MILLDNYLGKLREGASLFFRPVSYRHGRGAMAITTIKSIRDWTELQSLALT